MTITINDDMTVDSRDIAKGCELDHRVAIQLINTHKDIMESDFGLVTFQMESVKIPGQRGAKRFKVARLTEDQATFLITLFKNKPKVVRFKALLVKAYSHARKMLLDRTMDPSWREARSDAALNYRVQCKVLYETRRLRGKETRAVHFMTEAKLLNGLIKGIYKGANRDSMNTVDLEAVKHLEAVNSVLIAMDVPYPQRKAQLSQELTQFRQKKLSHRKNAQPQLALL